MYSARFASLAQVLIAGDNHMNNFASTKDQLIQAIRDNGGTYFADNKISCWHGPDRHPSANLRQGPDGRWRYKCHTCGAGGDYYDISGAKPSVMETPTMPTPTKLYTGIEVADYLKNLGSHTTYRYADSTDQCVGLTVRVDTSEGKTFRQFTPVGDKYAMSGPPKWVPYQLGGIKPGRLLIVEGEKCCDYARSLGINCTTWAGGSKAVNKTDWSLIKNDNIILWPDNDECGVEAMKAVSGLVTGDCQVMEPTGGQGDDLCDYAGDPAQLIASYQVQSMFAKLQAKADRRLAGELKPSPMPSFPVLAKTTGIMSPGSVNVLVGTAGGGKSTFLTQCMREWLRVGVPFGTLMLESGVDFHIERAIGQEMGEPKWMDPDWNSNPANAPTIKASYLACEQFIAALDKCLYDTPAGMATLDYTIGWIASQARAGKKVVIVDPISLIYYDDTSKIPAGTKRLVKECIAIAQECECSVILVNHFNKGLPGQRTMQGGVSLTDHTDCVVELQSMPVEEEMDVLMAGMDHVTSRKIVSRTMHVTKARRGTKTWHKIGLRYDSQTLTYIEQGIVDPQKGSQ